MNRETPRWVLIARILRARGNKGEVAAELLTDFPQRLTELKEVFVGGSGDGGEPRAMALRSCWLSQNHRGQAVFHFEGVNSISEAEKFRGLEVLLPIEQRVSLPAGQYFVSDLLGCSVFEIPSRPPIVASSPCSLAEAPALLGTVRDVQFPGEELAGTPLLEVETAKGEILIPLAADICTRIDIRGRRIDVALPEGLSELNPH
ncbi:MAG TPA: 16S rRNA processing protein RimM [Candidatus Angelobacter sp.]|nr:16S rRNA processing protein RimM [Candidatus Angelobacter sp.]